MYEKGVEEIAQILRASLWGEQKSFILRRYLYN